MHFNNNKKRNTVRTRKPQLCYHIPSLADSIRLTLCGHIFTIISHFGSCFTQNAVCSPGALRLHFNDSLQMLFFLLLNMNVLQLPMSDLFITGLLVSFSHHRLFSLISFQTCMRFFLTSITKDLF